MPRLRSTNRTPSPCTPSTCSGSGRIRMSHRRTASRRSRSLSSLPFARLHHIELIGNAQPFGHMENTLAIPFYRPMAENAWVVSPAVEKTYDYLKDVFAEIVPSYESRLFHINSDEVSGLGDGPARSDGGFDGCRRCLCLSHRQGRCAGETLWQAPDDVGRYRGEQPADHRPASRRTSSSSRGDIISPTASTMPSCRSRGPGSISWSRRA